MNFVLAEYLDRQVIFSGKGGLWKIHPKVMADAVSIALGTDAH